MNAVLVDSSVLLDVIVGDSPWRAWSEGALTHHGERRRLLVNQAIYAEVSVRFRRSEELDAVLDAAWIDRETVPWEAAFLAGKAHVIYRRRGGRRSSPLPDFFIGAHAALAGYAVLTRDPRRFRTYFPKVALIAPALT